MIQAIQRTPVGRHWAVPLGLCLGFILVASDNGGVAPSTYCLAGAVLAVVALAASVRPEPPLVPLRGHVLPVGLLALAGWEFASMSWSADATAAVPDAFRVATYGLLALAVISWSGTRSIPLLAGAAWLGCTAIAAVGVGVRLAPGSAYAHTPGVAGRLFVPVGYWNGLAMIAGIGLVLAIGLVVDARPSVARTAAAASTPLLGLALYLTFSRGSIAATALGAALVVAAHRRCTRVVVAIGLCGTGLAVPVLAAVARPGISADTLTARSSASAHLVAVALLGGCALAAVLVRWFQKSLSLGLRRRWRGADFALRRVAVVVIALASAGAILGVAVSQNGSSASGGPSRLLATTLDVRPELWRVAASMFASHPVFGIGAGGFARAWLLHRTTPIESDFAHSAYLQTAAETGAVGLLLLIASLGSAAVAGIAARRRPLVPACLAGFLMFAVHAGIDWDWQLPAVGLLGVGLGACLAVANARPTQRPTATRRRAVAMVATALALAAIAFGLTGMAIGAEYLEAAQHEVGTGQWAPAVGDARSARSWMPWSTAPSLAEGYAYLSAGHRGAARRAFRAGIALDPAEWRLQFGIAQASDGATRRRALDAASALNPYSRELLLYARLVQRSSGR